MAATLTPAQLAQLWTAAGGNPQAAPMAVGVAEAESSGTDVVSALNPNGTRDIGFWQINTSHGPAASLDPLTNAQAAVALSNNGTDWRAWCTAYSDGACGTKGGTYLGPGSPALRTLPNATTAVDVSTTAGTAAANAPRGVTSATQTHGLLAGLDGMMNVTGVSALNPIDDVKVILSRGVFAVIGLGIMTMGAVMLIRSAHNRVTTTQQAAAQTVTQAKELGGAARAALAAVA